MDIEGKSEVGIYQPFAEDPDLCTPFSVNSWELTLLMNHFNPRVRELAQHISNVRLSEAANASQRMNPIFNRSFHEHLKKYSALNKKGSLHFEPALQPLKVGSSKSVHVLDGFSAFAPSQYEQMNN